MSSRHCEGHQEVAAAAVVEGRLSEILGDFLGYGVYFSIVHRGLGKDPCLAVNEVVVAEIRSGEELEVHTCLAHQLLGNRLVQPHLYKNAFVFGKDLEPGCESVIFIGKGHFNTAFGGVDPAGTYYSEYVPLLGSVHKTDAAAGSDAVAALDNFKTCEFFIVESTVVDVVVHQHIRAACLEIAEVVEFHALCIGCKRQCSSNNCKDQK